MYKATSNQDASAALRPAQTKMPPHKDVHAECRVPCPSVLRMAAQEPPATSRGPLLHLRLFDSRDASLLRKQNHCRRNLKAGLKGGKTIAIIRFKNANTAIVILLLRFLSDCRPMTPRKTTIATGKRAVEQLATQA